VLPRSSLRFRSASTSCTARLPGGHPLNRAKRNTLETDRYSKRFKIPRARSDAGEHCAILELSRRGARRGFPAPVCGVHSSAFIGVSTAGLRTFDRVRLPKKFGSAVRLTNRRCAVRYRRVRYPSSGAERCRRPPKLSCGARAPQVQTSTRRRWWANQWQERRTLKPTYCNAQPGEGRRFRFGPKPVPGNGVPGLMLAPWHRPRAPASAHEVVSIRVRLG